MPKVFLLFLGHRRRCDEAYGRIVVLLAKSIQHMLEFGAVKGLCNNIYII